MRIVCPVCGARDRREFYYQGAAVALERPEPGANAAVWDAYMHLRDNPAGETRDLWFHEAGCGGWIVVRRDTVSHAVHASALVSEAPR